ncbi:hypothetical protein NVP1165O_37 [Vibrio phage 1.165.O._10N.261.51.B7]|nr:hypothetical protein NVP1165O_37 [Vibrio phage 1.165.O._10N.261.51.B7]AUR92745.1 hypothetical protein NVP1176O_43 [Vibrio phage 1.176.O._10N.261.55.F5]
MAYYTWKGIRNKIPQSFIDEWCHEKGVEEFELHGGESYNWDYWEMVADYIQKLKALTGE